MLNNFNQNPTSSGGSGSSSSGASGAARLYPPDIDDFDPMDVLINYNEKFKNASKTLYRDQVIKQTLSCLIGKFKPNALLIGAAGVGKTKIVEDIARRIANNDLLIPSQLTDHIIYELPISSIVSGSGLVGDVERKINAILEFASDPKNKAILFIDEIHVVISGSMTYEKIAQIMKPALARGDIKVIGATTLQESQNLMDDPAFNRRFTRLIVDELSQEQTKNILKQMSTSMFEHYEKKIAINDKVIDAIVSVADEFKRLGSHRPDNAITLLDRSMADALIQRKNIEAIAVAEHNTAVLNALKASPTIMLSKSQMKKTALALMTGNNAKSNIDMDNLKDKLSIVKGQDEAINYVLDTIQRDNLGLYPRQKPLTMLFAGNSGVGKSEVAKIIANEITGVGPIVINMTEYHSPASINRIIGSPAGYVGSDSKAELPFDILESNPYQVILLDEFEKGDKSVQRLFMSAFDEGYIKTAKGKLVDFSKTIIIATTNAGHTTKTSGTIGFSNDRKNVSKANIDELSNFFDIELLNRFTKILNFNPITKDLFKEILADVYTRDVTRIKSQHKAYAFLSNALTDDELNKLCEKEYEKSFGARPVKRAIQKYIEDAVMNYNTATNNANASNSNIDTDITK